MAADAPPSPAWGEYYGKLYSRRVDLVGDYAGSEPFLVEGDSLLLHVFSDELLDFQDGFQMLHAVWLVESFLHDLQRRECNFHVAFFHDREPLCIPPHANDAQKAKYRLARAAIVRHLQTHLTPGSSPIELHLFPSLTSDAFVTAAAANSYMFVMMNDGAADACQCDRHAPANAALRLSICSLIVRGYSVALINGLEWRDTKVITAVIEGRAKSDKTALPAVLDLPRPDQDLTPHVEILDAETCDAFAKHHQSAPQKLSERLYLVIATLKTLLSDKALPQADVASFAAHAVLQSQLSLESRSSSSAPSTEASEHFLRLFSETALAIMKSPRWLAFVEDKQLPCEMADLVDGRLYNRVLANQIPFPQLSGEFVSLINSFMPLGAIESAAQHTESYVDPAHASTEPSGPSQKLLPFTAEVFDKHLQPIKLDVDNQAAQQLNDDTSRTFRELTHWHNSKRPLNRKAVMASKDREAFYARRRDQRFMAEMIAYAASLTNAVGKALEPETVVVRDGQPAPSHTGGKAQQHSSQNAKAAGGKNKQKNARMDKLVAEQEKKEAVQNQKIFNSWHAVCKDIQREKQPAARYTKTVQYLNSLSSSRQAVVGSEVELYALSCLLELWKASVASNPKSPNLALAAKIWNNSAQLIHGSGITKTMELKLQQTVASLGLPFPIRAAQGPDRKLPFDYFLQEKNTSLKIPAPSKDFQLLHCGPYFDRKMDSAPDSRVPFMPDGWQREVLDAVDADKSLLVVAPTSSGKTFISFYAMKRVLEGSDDGVLVYVAPTKALVNQIAAEIQARFSKTYKHAGKSVWAIHTRDYRVNNATGCQVLVTVPHILQIMLMAPAHANSWSSRVKRIIFDEVHCIGQADDGIVWEQLLLLAPCPIVALSATVGNPDEFRNWLASTQKATGNDLVTVHHPHRYSDLRKYVYVPPENFTFAGLPKAPAIPRVDLDRGEDFHFVHPVASLLQRSRGMPEDFSLEARDCFTLWKAMKAHESATHKVPDALDPQRALPDVITQADIIGWCQSLKELLNSWMKDRDAPFDAVVQELGRDVNKLGGEHDGGQNEESLCDTVLPLLCRLQEQSALPAILFNYDRGSCEAICEAVLTKLKEAEQGWKDTSPVWAKKMTDWEAWKKNSKNASKKSTSKKAGNKPEEGMSKADVERETGSAEADTWESFNPDAPMEGYHFKDGSKLNESELQEYARELRWRGVPDMLIEALGRGIAVHHAGMNRKYRHVVELLFRKGFLRVIVATGTLALGINMPCKTVVFSGDSLFLTALNFRQAAGRAGRRGFDVLGNVVFHGVPMSKVYRLMSSRLPSLTGHFPLTTTLVLRLCTLLTESKNAPFAVRAVDALLSQPRLCLGGAENHAAVLHHLRFSLEYLRRQHLLSPRGQPLNFASAVSHLYYAEPSNFAFHALLKDGYFHRLCVGIRRQPEAAERITRTLMLVLAHIFGRQYLRHVDREFVEDVVKNSPSSIILAPLPADAANVLRTHNTDTLDVFKTYVRTYVSQHGGAVGPDNVLPLTGVKCGGDGDGDDGDGSSTANIRSAFVALSGHAPDGAGIASIGELCRTVRSGVYLEESVVPHIPLTSSTADEKGSRDLPLNAYLLDFFKHGDVAALAEGNGIRKGDVWFVLSDFSMVLATLIASLEGFVGGGDGGENDMDAAMGGEGEEEKAEERLWAGAAAPDHQAAETKVVEVRPKKVLKKAVADSWDDAADEEETDEEDADGAIDANGVVKGPAWEDDGAGSLLDVLEAFKKLSAEFNEKFKAMWA